MVSLAKKNFFAKSLKSAKWWAYLKKKWSTLPKIFFLKKSLESPQDLSKKFQSSKLKTVEIKDCVIIVITLL